MVKAQDLKIALIEGSLPPGLCILKLTKRSALPRAPLSKSSRPPIKVSVVLVAVFITAVRLP